MDENLVWLTQKTEESKCNKTNFTFFPTHSKCNWTVKKKWLPISTSTPPPPPFHFQSYLPFLAKFLVPQSDSIFGRSYSLFNDGGGGNFQLWFVLRKPPWVTYILVSLLIMRSAIKLVLSVALLNFPVELSLPRSWVL